MGISGPGSDFTKGIPDTTFGDITPPPTISPTKTPGSGTDLFVGCEETPAEQALSLLNQLAASTTPEARAGIQTQLQQLLTQNPAGIQFTQAQRDTLTASLTQHNTAAFQWMTNIIEARDPAARATGEANLARITQAVTLMQRLLGQPQVGIQLTQEQRDALTTSLTQHNTVGFQWMSHILRTGDPAARARGEATLATITQTVTLMQRFLGQPQVGIQLTQAQRDALTTNLADHNTVAYQWMSHILASRDPAARARGEATLATITQTVTQIQRFLGQPQVGIQLTQAQRTNLTTTRTRFQEAAIQWKAALLEARDPVARARAEASLATIAQTVLQIQRFLGD